MLIFSSVKSTIRSFVRLRQVKHTIANKIVEFSSLCLIVFHKLQGLKKFTIVSCVNLKVLQSDTIHVLFEAVNASNGITINAFLQTQTT